MSQSPPQTATFDRPHGVRFSLRSVFVGMTVLAVVAAVLGPWLHDRPWLFVAIMIGFFLGAVLGGVVCYLKHIRVRSRAGNCVLTIPVLRKSRSRRLVYFLFFMQLWIYATILVPLIMFVITSGDLRYVSAWFCHVVAGSLSAAFGCALSSDVVPAEAFGDSLAIRISERGAILTHFVERFYQWDDLRIVFMRNGNVRFRLDYYPEFPLLAEIASTDSKQIRTFLTHNCIPYLTDEA